MARWWDRHAVRLVAPLAVMALLLSLVARYNVTSSGESSMASPTRPRVLSLKEEQLLEMELDRVIADIRARFAARQEAVQALLAKRATLKQTVARFRALNHPGLPDVNQLSEEIVCGHVLGHAEILLQDRNDSSEVLESLRRQVREHLEAERAAPK